MKKLILLGATTPIMNLNSPLIFAHRGASMLAPENTLSAFQLAYQLGAKALELDIQLTKDNQLRIFHDDTLERTSTGKGPLTEQLDADIEKLDAGNWFAPQFIGEKIPTLEKALEVFNQWDILINIELKADDTNEKLLVDALAKVLVHTSFSPKRILLSSFSKETIILLKNTLPDYPRAFNVHTSIPHAFIFAKENLCMSIHPNVELLKNNANHWITEAHAHQLRVHPYVINDAKFAQKLLAAGIDGFFTDTPALYHFHDR